MAYAVRLAPSLTVGPSAAAVRSASDLQDLRRSLLEPPRQLRPSTASTSQPADGCELSAPSPNLIMKPGTTPVFYTRNPDASHRTTGRRAGRYRLRFALWHDRLMPQLLGFIIDCPDPIKLATFYSQVTGRAIMEGSGDSMAAITFGEVDLAFQRVEDYRPPRWPDDEHPKQYHLDFEVDEIEPEQRRVVKLGATLQKDFVGPDGYGWQVYTDPAGHPFCLCRHEGVT
jgi:predicted enzyme related to lactoylglutathione lyase